MKALSSQPKQVRPWRGFLRFALLLVLLAALALQVEHWRGQWALQKWKSEMTAQGEVLDAKALWPKLTVKSEDFVKQLDESTAKLPPQLRLYASGIDAVVQCDSGGCRRGSQEAQPVFSGKHSDTNNWKKLDVLVRQNRTTLQALRYLMNDPAPTLPHDVRKSLEGSGKWPTFVSERIASQALRAAAIDNLHNGDLPSAVEDLGALLSFANVHEQDPMLVAYMIRVAILGLSVDACWDALGAPGWTDAQLEALQMKCVDSKRFLEQMPRALEAERAVRLYELQWFRSHSYKAWQARYQELSQGFDLKPDPAVVTAGRQWLFHPTWSFAWSDQEELEYLQQTQRELALLRETTRRRSSAWLQDNLAALRENYQPPAAAWRFYMALPVVDMLAKTNGPHQTYPCREFTRAWSTTMMNLTLHEMVKAAIALKRYEMKYGQLPEKLSDLVPEFLAVLPCDFMDGQTLRYRCDWSTGSFTLYSVGADGCDDGGNVVHDTYENTGGNFSPMRRNSPWGDRDWVWPKMAGHVNQSLTVGSRK